jgi:hypothetical protein
LCSSSIASLRPVKSRAAIRDLSISPPFYTRHGHSLPAASPRFGGFFPIK